MVTLNVKSTSGEIVFVDGSELHFKEYFIAIPVLKRLAYSYHYQDKGNLDASDALTSMERFIPRTSR